MAFRERKFKFITVENIVSNLNVPQEYKNKKKRKEEEKIRVVVFFQAEF